MKRRSLVAATPGLALAQTPAPKKTEGSYIELRYYRLRNTPQCRRIERGPGGPYIWQWGNNPGYRSFAMASVTSKDGFVILTNSERGMPLAASVAHSILPADHNAFRFSWVA